MKRIIAILLRASVGVDVTSVLRGQLLSYSFFAKQNKYFDSFSIDGLDEK